MAKDSNGTATEPLCTKCENNPRGKNHDWCNECKSEQQKRYTQDRDDLLERRGFRAGSAAMRNNLLTVLLEANPNGRMLVHEVAAFISTAELPVFTRSNPVSNGQGGS
jgi:hypothetical protein